MADTLVLDVTRARTLLTMYRWRADDVADDVEVLGRKLAAATPFLGWSADGDPGPLVLRRLQALADQLNADHDDLAWRIAYVEALGTDGLPTAIPRRSARLRDHGVVELIEMLDTDAYREALDELAIRAVTDPEASRVIARRLGAAGARDLRDRIHIDMYEVTSEWSRHGLAQREGWVEDAASVAADFDALFQSWGVLLATFSHHQTGAELIEDLFHLEQPDSDTNFLPVALLHGQWDEDLLFDLYERIFTTPSDFWNGFGRLPGALELIEAEHFFGRLTDPHAVLLEAIARQPDLARRLVMEEDAFARLAHFDDYGPFGGIDLDRTNTPSRMVGGSRIGDGLASLFASVLVDPARTEEIYRFLAGGSRVDENGYEVHVPGLFHEIAELGLPRSAAFRQVMADVWNLQWHNLADLGNDVRPTDSVGGAVLAEIFEDETARLEVMAGFGAYLEILYAEAFVEGDATAVDRAGVGALRAFQHIDHALDSLQPGATDRSLLRGAFRTGAGFGAKQLVPFLAGPATWKTVAAGFVVSETISRLGEIVLPDDVSRYPTSTSVLHDLFIAEPVSDGPPLPTTAEVIFANAALAARPDLAADVEPTRWLVDGVITPPPSDAGSAATDDFGFWFGRNFTGDSPFQPMITAPARDIAGWLATEEFLES
ncbi:MAG: hypothetical protein AAGA90_15210 [Actinomycetota bacterium]